jgi:hypothetical protein
MGVVRVGVILGMVQSFFFMVILVLARKAAAYVGSGMGFVVMGCRVLYVSRRHGE